MNRPEHKRLFGGQGVVVHVICKQQLKRGNSPLKRFIMFCPGLSSVVALYYADTAGCYQDKMS